MHKYANIRGHDTSTERGKKASYCMKYLTVIVKIKLDFTAFDGIEFDAIMTENVFKAPRNKRLLNRRDHELGGISPPKKGRTKDDFYTFCSWVLTYTQYEQWKQDELRARDNTSPMDSASSTAESYTSESTLSSSSKDDSGHNIDLQDSDDESWELITCFCMKPYAGRPMIECSQCNTWIHLSCAKIRKSNIPDTFVCNCCKEKRFKSRKSNRVRIENKRITI